jgi:hypothetical protein
MMELEPIFGLTLRRALFAILLDAGRAITVADVVAALHAAGVTVYGAKPVNKVVADMLAYQVRAGRVTRTARATYAVLPKALSRSTQRRCRHWRERL